MTSAEAKRWLKNNADELDRIKAELNQLAGQISGSFRGIGAEQAAEAGRKTAGKCGSIANTLRGMNTSFLDKRKEGKGGGGGGGRGR